MFPTCNHYALEHNDTGARFAPRPREPKISATRGLALRFLDSFGRAAHRSAVSGADFCESDRLDWQIASEVDEAIHVPGEQTARRLTKEILLAHA